MTCQPQNPRLPNRLNNRVLRTTARTVLAWVFVSLELLLVLQCRCWADSSTNGDIDLDNLVIKFENWFNTHDSEEALEKLPDEFAGVFKMLTSAATLQDQIVNLRETIRRADSSLREKEVALERIQQQLAVIKLSPKQLADIERYNKTIDKEPSSATEWLAMSSTRYDILKDIVISIISLGVGMWAEQVRKGWATKRKASRAK
jgi:septal ring factor EnvC (AmiA/AmiB activator)